MERDVQITDDMSEGNRQVAERLREVADLLGAQEASPYRVAAYRRAAATVEALDADVRALAARGADALTALAGVDRDIASAIVELARSGRLALLDRLRGTLDAERVFQTLPGVGPRLARTLHDVLGVDSLEALETAIHDGRLEAVPGLGPRRIAALRAVLGARLARVRPPRSTSPVLDEPPVSVLLEVDAEYRRRASRDELPRIAPRRFNPDHQAWLPILHLDREGWRFTALFSNTARAHEMGRTGDWVILYFTGPDGIERQRTVVTEHHGLLAGQRVVRGRESDCLRFAQDERTSARDY
jgi:hypothetical protein